MKHSHAAPLSDNRFSALLNRLHQLSHAQKMCIVKILQRELAEPEDTYSEEGEATKQKTAKADFFAFVAKQRICVQKIEIPNRDERNAR